MFKLKVAALLCCMMSSASMACDTQPKKWKELTFINSPEVNLHSFLTYSARKSSDLSKLPLSLVDRAKFEDAIKVYAQYTSQKGFHHVFTDSPLAELTNLLSVDSSIVEASSNELSRAYFALIGAYKEKLWPIHCQQNQIWRKALFAKLNQYGNDIEKRLNTLYQSQNMTVPSHVIYPHAFPFSRQGATTSGRTATTYINTMQRSFHDWYALELSFHELSHMQFLRSGKLRQQINDIFAQHELEHHAGIWHPILFYTVGEVTRQAIAKEKSDYVPYAHLMGLYDRVWQYQAELEQHWQPYINGQTTLEEALQNLAKAIKNRA